MGRHISSPVTSSHLLSVADATSYQTTPPVQRQHNSPYTCNSSPPYMNTPELRDHERKRKARIPFSTRSRLQFSSASDASQLQQKIHTSELLDAPYKNSCAHLDDSSQLCRLFLAPTCDDHPSPCLRQCPCRLLQVVLLNDNHLSPCLRQHSPSLRRTTISYPPRPCTPQPLYHPLLLVATPTTVSSAPLRRYTSDSIARPEALAGSPTRGKRSFKSTLL
jgi:hypothetical protein